MKKISLVAFLILSICIFNMNANAQSKYVSETLKEACETEGLTCNFKEREYDESLPNIYVFRGNGCGYCKRLLSFLASIMDEYGKYANVVVFEVGKNKTNWALYEKVGASFGKEVSGYPYMVIGEKTFDGYATSYDEDIKSAIKNLYDSKEKKDFVAQFLEEKEEEEPSSNRGTVLAFIFGIIVVLGGFLGYKVAKN